IAAATAAWRKHGLPDARPRDPRIAATPSARTAGGRSRFASAKPRQREPTSACGIRTVTSRDHQPLQLRPVRRPDTPDAFQFRHGMKGAVLLPVVEDLLRRDRADPR